MSLLVPVVRLVFCLLHMYDRTVLYYCTVLLCCARSVVLYTAQEGSRATGTTRGTHPRAPQGREQRDTVLRTKLTAPRIARAPELVKWNLVVGGSWFVVRGRRFLCTYSTVVQICCTCADVQ